MLPDLSLAQAELVQIPARSDNYIYLLHDRALNVTAVIDPSDAEPVETMLRKRGWALDIILCTHHHNDHVGGIELLKQEHGCIVIGYAHDAHRIPDIDRAVEEGELLTVGRFQAKVLFVPGHTLGHVAYYFADLGLAFCGDTMFSLGCGRLFEGTAGQMLASLRRLSALPATTWICCAHEYTQANGRFALSVEPENIDLTLRIDEIAQLRAQGMPTVPSRLGDEMKTNPFLRPDSPEIRRNLELEHARDVDVFTELRKRKDSFT